jgi:PAS domain S-box-containing protein
MLAAASARSLLTSGLVLCVCLVCLLWVWRYATQEAQATARARFDARVARTESALQDRLNDYERLLRGAAGLFVVANTPVTRTQWHDWVAAMHIAQHYPGVAGIGYLTRLHAADKPGFLRDLRRQGETTLQIQPAGQRSEYIVVTYLEPSNEYNRQVAGYDVAADSLSRAAIERARDTGQASVSRKITYQDGQGGAGRAGFMMCLPVYRKAMPLDNIAQRRAALQGYVYSVFRINDLMSGLLGRDGPDLDFEIFDGTAMAENALMYDDDALPRFDRPNPAVFSTQVTLDVHGATWTLLLSSLPRFESTIDRQGPRIVLVAGSVISLLFALLVWAWVTTRGRARMLAHRMSDAAHEHEAQLRSIVDSAVDGIVTIDDRGILRSFSRSAEHIFGYRADQMVGAHVATLVPDALRPRLAQELAQVLGVGGQRQPGPGQLLTGRRADGSLFPMELALSVMTGGAAHMSVGMVRDVSRRMQAERERIASEERLALALDGSGLALWDWNVPTGTVYLSERWSAMLGGPLTKTVTTFGDLEKLLHPQDKEKLGRSVRAALKGEVLFYRAEHRVRTPAGEWRWILSTGKVVERDEQGRALRMIGTNADITDAKRAAEDLMRFKYVLDNTLDMIFMFDAETLKFVYLNRGAVESMGYTRAELLQMTPYDIKPAIPEPEFRRLILPLLSGERRSIAFETVHRRKDGSDFPVGISLQLVQQEGERALFVAIVRDISQRREAERELRASAARIRAIVDTVVDGIITVDDQGTIETVNPSARRMFGYELSDMIGANIDRLIPQSRPGEPAGDTPEQRVARMAEFVGVGRELVGERKDGSYFPIELSVSETRVGERPMFTGVVRDITERKKMDRMKSEFVSTVSHELRTPLTSILGSLGLISGNMSGDLPEQTKTLVDIAHKNSERLVRLINDILDVEKIESENMTLDLQSLVVLSLVRQSIEANEAYARQFGATIVLHAERESAVVRADVDRFVQVMNNLLSNAAKYSPAHGVIDVTVGRAGSRVRVTVADQGPGIPVEFRDRVFTKFAQADSSDTRKKGGTGLGLSIAKAIARKFGGDLTFDSLPGKGSRFYFDLVEAGGAPAVTEVPPANARVLICEDDPDVALLLRAWLRDGGFDADIAHDALEAKRCLALKTYAAMTLDIMLPDQDGLSLVRELRAAEATRRMPIVVVSVKAEQGRAELNGGAFEIIDWLGKPVQHEQLIASLQRAVRRRRGDKPRILHVEDDSDVRVVLAAMLSDTAEIVPAADVRSALARLGQHEFDLVVLDVSLPDGSGLDLLSHLDRQLPLVPVLIFSAHELNAASAKTVSAALVKSRTSNRQLREVIASLLHSSTTPGARAH